MNSSGKADWWQLHIQCQQTNHAVVDEWLDQLDASAITLSDAQDDPVYLTQPEQETWWPTLHITALLTTAPSVIHTQQLEAFKRKTIITAWHIEAISDQDWQSNCQTHHRATKHGQRLWIYPQWDPPPTDDHNAVHVHMDPGLAFGTGTHPSTALCLAWLDQHIEQQSVCMDYGCGSGILGIAAIKLGIDMVHAIDHDPQALLSTQQNAANNHVKEQLKVYDTTPPPHIKADIVVANLLANPLIALAHTLATHTKSGGRCVLSGILTSQIKLLEPYYEEYFTPMEVTVKDGWACWVLAKP